ncbi:MAG: hypothetical protein QM765_26935 [Myxococcales bacterium]
MRTDRGSLHRDGRWIAIGAFLVSSLSCSQGPGGSADSGGSASALDASTLVSDAAASDAAQVDAAVSEVVDAAVSDAAASEPDAAPAPVEDASLPDADLPDVGTFADAGSFADAGVAGEDAGPTYPCSPEATCTLQHDCMGYVDNAGKSSFGLRMGQLHFVKPGALSQGIMAVVFSSQVLQDAPACRLTGTATTNWLLQFDTAAASLKTGGAQPVTDPTAGYSFVDRVVSQGSQQIHLQPVVYSGVSLQGGSFSTAPAEVLQFPMFLNAQGTSLFVLPLHHLALAGTLASDQNCIGRYNAEGLDPANSCQGDNTHPTFLPGGSGTGCISLEEADGIVVEALSQTLCVLLSGNASMYGTKNGPTTVCKRDSQGQIVYQGDWCLATNAAASAGCADAVSMEISFEAGSVTINN